jgi:hypothetical protein
VTCCLACWPGFLLLLLAGCARLLPPAASGRRLYYMILVVLVATICSGQGRRLDLGCCCDDERFLLVGAQNLLYDAAHPGCFDSSRVTERRGNFPVRSIVRGSVAQSLRPSSDRRSSSPGLTTTETELDLCSLRRCCAERPSLNIVCHCRLSLNHRFSSRNQS